jgi:hypothetical protein
MIREVEDPKVHALKVHLCVQSTTVSRKRHIDTRSSSPYVVQCRSPVFLV